MKIKQDSVGLTFPPFLARAVTLAILLLLQSTETAFGFLSSTNAGISTIRERSSRHATAIASTSTSSNSNGIPSNLKILILPGFGNDSVDYLLKGSLVDSLVEQGWAKQNVNVLRVARADWLQVFWRGALDLQFWTATADPTRQAFRWYLERIAEQIQELCGGDDEDDDGSRVVLVGHSAGGWLGRAALGFGSQVIERANNGNGASSGSTTATTTTTTTTGPTINLDRVAGLVSLGAPHLPPPPGVMDMTRGALRITNEQFPGSYHKTVTDDGLFYITAVGLSVQGEEQQRSSPLEPTSIKGFAYNSYEAVCGNGTAIGDGVVPFSAAHLDDALQIDLEGVLHSINAPENWYGSSQVIERWHTPLLKEIQACRKVPKNTRQKTNGSNDFMAVLSNAFESTFKSS